VAKLYPSLLSANFLQLQEELKALEKAGVDGVHFDVMDGQFVPNISIGLPILEAVRKGTCLPIDVHLMVENVKEYIDKYDMSNPRIALKASHIFRVADAAKEIAKEVDAMIVIGGRHSSNTQKLYEICRQECNNTYYIQTLEDLDLSELKENSYVGITAGASTPNNIIEEVHTNVRTEF